MASKGGGGSKGSGNRGRNKPNINKPIEVDYDSKNKEWRAQRQGAERALAVGPRQEDVENRARKVAENTNSELIIKDKNHVIRERESYGNDPLPPRDKEH